MEKLGSVTTLNWRAVCLMAGDEDVVSRLITVIACFFIFSAAWFCCGVSACTWLSALIWRCCYFRWSASGANAAMPARILAGVAGAEWLLIYWLTQAVGLTHFFY